MPYCSLSISIFPRLVDVTYPQSYIPLLPARPAICLISYSLSCLLCAPSNLDMFINTIRLIGRLTPRPIASVATTTFVSPDKNISNCLFLICGGRLPYIVLTFIPFCSRRAATSKTSFLENSMSASPRVISVLIL